MADPTAVLHDLTGWALERKVQLDGLEVVRPSLEDVYLQITERAWPTAARRRAPPPRSSAASAASVSPFARCTGRTSRSGAIPASAFFTFVFPLMFLVIFSSIFGTGQVTVAPGVDSQRSDRSTCRRSPSSR